MIEMTDYEKLELENKRLEHELNAVKAKYEAYVNGTCDEMESLKREVYEAKENSKDAQIERDEAQIERDAYKALILEFMQLGKAGLLT